MLDMEAYAYNSKTWEGKAGRFFSSLNKPGLQNKTESV